MIFIVLYLETICSKKDILINNEINNTVIQIQRVKPLVFNYFLIIPVFVSHVFYICSAFHMYIF